MTSLAPFSALNANDSKRSAQPILWQQWLNSTPHADALITAQQRYTWQDLALLIDHYAMLINQQEIQAGDVLTIVGKNSPEWVIVYLAALQLGITPALVMPQPTALLLTKIQTLYTSTQPVWLWFVQEKDRIQWLQMPSPQMNIHLLDVESLSNIDLVSVRAKSTDNSTRLPQYDTHQLSSLIFTSGSTGKPKVVAHNSEQHIASAKGLLSRFPYSRNDTWLLSLPMYHVSGLAIIYRWLIAGGGLKVGDGDLSRDIKGITHASLVATQLKRLLDEAQSQIQSLTHVLLGGSHIPHSLSLQAAKMGIETWLGYGMTEAASTVTAKQIDEHDNAGYLLPNRQLMIKQQRIYIKGETLASGYYSQGVLTPLTNADHWFDTQDLGEWHNGALRIIGRADNQFISGGENIHCEEIEAILTQYPTIEFAMVIPVVDSEFGVRSVAVIRTVNETQQVIKSQMELWLVGKLEKFKWPLCYLEMPDTLNQPGIKVSRNDVKAWLSENQNKYIVYESEQ